MEEIKFTHTASCSECKGILYPERYNNPQSPCYRCESIATAHENKNCKPLKERQNLSPKDRQKRDYKIMELRTSGKTFREIANVMNMPVTAVQAVVKHYEQ